MPELTSRQIEQIINKHPEAVVRYRSSHHQGYENENPVCAGLIFQGDLYLVFKGKCQVPPHPYICVETETHASVGGSSKLERFIEISDLEVVTDIKEPDLKLAEIALTALRRNKAPKEYWLYITESIDGFGRTRRIP
jgi:hypothetical protein